MRCNQIWIIGLLGLFLLSTVGAETIKLATTTSTENSGLLAYLLPIFKQASGIDVDVIAVGTGKAFKLGENGDVDLLMVHDRKGEDDFVAKGFATRRWDLMANDFLLVGPPADPAGLKSAKRAVEAFRLLGQGGKAKFVSRGDDSGTHRAEKRFWSQLNLVPKGDWYIEAGQGMEQVLTMASEVQGYTLTDRATYLALLDKIESRPAFEGDSALYNPYGLLDINPAKHPGTKTAAARKFIDWLVSPAGQKTIADFKVKGVQLFFPTAKP